jgi:hypothetical protein
MPTGIHQLPHLKARSELMLRLDGPAARAVIDVRVPDAFEGPLNAIAPATPQQPATR